MRSSSFIWKQAWRPAAFHGNAILWRETFHEITHCCGHKPCARAPDSRGGWLARRVSLADMSQQSPFIPSPVLTAPAFLEATADESIFVPIALDGTDGVPAHSGIAVTGLPQGSTLSKGRPFGDTGWKLERDEIADLQLVVPNSASGQAKLTIQLIAPDGTLVADAEILLEIATASQDPLPRNAEDTDVAQAPANREPTLLGMSVLGVSPKIADAQLTHEGPKRRPDPRLREAKPSAAATERGEEPVQSEPRIVQSRPPAPTKRTVTYVGTNEVKTSVFVKLWRSAVALSKGHPGGGQRHKIAYRSA